VKNEALILSYYLPSIVHAKDAKEDAKEDAKDAKKSGLNFALFCGFSLRSLREHFCYSFTGYFD
jgi:hypothetical protein